MKKTFTWCLIFSLVFNNLAFATQQILELDVQGSQTPQRLHTILPSYKIADVSHIEIDAEKQQIVVHKLNRADKLQSGKDIVPVSPLTTPVILQKWNVQNLPWEDLLKAEMMKSFLIQNTAYLIPVDQDGYKLEFRGRLKGGGNTGSTGGGGGGGSVDRSSSSYSGVTSDGYGGYTLNVPVHASPSNYESNSNDHYISGTPHHGGNDSTGGYGGSNGGSGSNSRSLNTVNYQGVPAVDLDPMMGYVYFPKPSCGYYRSQGMGHHGKNNLGQSFYYDDMTGLCYTQTKGQKNGFLPHDYQKDPLDDKIHQALQAKIAESFYQGIRKATTSSQFSLNQHQRVLSPLFYLVRTEITDMLKDVSHSRNYTLSRSRQWLEAHFAYRVFFRHAWNVWTYDDIGYDLKQVAHDKLTKYAPEFLKIGLDIFKASNRPVYKGSKYLLTQDVKGHISVVCPYNGLAYPLFAEDRLLPDAYLPKEYVHHPLLDKPLWEQVHKYVQTSLSTLQGARTHLEPLFYITSKPLQEALVQAGKSSDYTSVKTRSALERQLRDAIEYHVFLTPLFNKDQIFNITKTLSPLLFNKGVDLLQASKMSLVKSTSTPYTLTLNTEGRLASLCPWNGLVYPLFPDDRMNSKAFLPTTYVRNGYDTYLEQFFYKLAGEAFEGQEQSSMRYVFSPLPYVSRTAFKDIPMKKENFPSLKESSVLLLEMAGDVMYGMPLEDLLNKAQKFFDKEIPFKKLNDDTLVHQHLSQNMLAKELREERWALGDQYWKTTSPVAQWAVVANVLEAVARQYNIVGASLIDTAKTRQMLDDLGFELPTFSQEELRTKILPCEKLDGFGRKLCEWVDFNFEPLFNGAIFLMSKGQKVPVNNKVSFKPRVDEPHFKNAPPVLQRQPDFKWTVKDVKVADKIGQHPKFGKICKDPTQKVGNKEVWWSKDTAKHGGSNYKLFEEKADHFKWIGDVDATGKVVLKHKSEIGMRIEKSEINWIK